MAKAVGRYGGVYVSHMRNESNQVLDAIRETIHIGEAAGIPSHVFHLKAAGEENWPRIKDAIALIQSARDRGLDVTADIYPYIRNGIGLTSFLHPRHYGEGSAPFLKTLGDAEVRARLRREVETTSDWENWYRHVGKNWDNVLVASVGGPLPKSYEGKSIAAIAKMRGEDEWTTFFELVRTGEVNVNPKSMDEEQKRVALRVPWVSVCTDSPPLNIKTATNAHPRAFGSFVRVLAKYVREENVLSLEQAVRQMSSLPANFLRLYDRGRIAVGMAADLLVFDPARVAGYGHIRKTAGLSRRHALCRRERESGNRRRPLYGGKWGSGAAAPQVKYGKNESTGVLWPRCGVADGGRCRSGGGHLHQSAQGAALGVNPEGVSRSARRRLAAGHDRADREHGTA